MPVETDQVHEETEDDTQANHHAKATASDDESEQEGGTGDKGRPESGFGIDSRCNCNVVGHVLVFALKGRFPAATAQIVRHSCV